jgi:hypothetical protein
VLGAAVPTPDEPLGSLTPCLLRTQSVCGCWHQLSEAQRAALPRPDLVAALNSGMIFYPSWAPTINMILQRGEAPLLVSAWAQPEAIGTRQMLLDSGGMPAEAGLDLHSNPFASLVPQSVMDDHGTCNFNSRYVVVVTPTGTGGVAPAGGTAIFTASPAPSGGAFSSVRHSAKQRCSCHHTCAECVAHAICPPGEVFGEGAPWASVADPSTRGGSAGDLILDPFADSLQ